MEIMHKGMWTGRRVLYLSVDAIRANPDQPRKYFEPEALSWRRASGATAFCSR